MLYEQPGVQFRAELGEHLAELDAVPPLAPIDFPIIYAGLFRPQYALPPIFALALRSEFFVRIFAGALGGDPQSRALPPALPDARVQLFEPLGEGVVRAGRKFRLVQFEGTEKIYLLGLVYIGLDVPTVVKEERQIPANRIPTVDPSAFGEYGAISYVFARARRALVAGEQNFSVARRASRNQRKVLGRPSAPRIR